MVFMLICKKTPILLRLKKLRKTVQKGKNKMVKIYALIFGKEGHRQRGSFGNTVSFSANNTANTLYREDATKTNDYCVLEVIAKDLDTALREVRYQTDDGILEDCRCGKIVIIRHA